MSNELIKQEPVSIVSVNPQELISQAIDKNLPIETLERLLVMRRELKAEFARDEYFRAMAVFQKECPVIEKTKKVYDKYGKLRYRYAPLDKILLQVKDLLQKNGFSYTIKTIQDKDSVTAICYAHHELGHTEETSFQVPIDKEAYMNVAQKVASALTFAKRYSFCDAFGILTGDVDDDSGYTGEPESKPAQNKTTQNKPVQKKAEVKTGFGAASEECKGMFQAIMALLREKQNNQDIFSTKDRIEIKKKADAVISDIKALTELYKVVNKITAEKRAGIKNGGKQ